MPAVRRPRRPAAGLRAKGDGEAAAAAQGRLCLWRALAVNAVNSEEARRGAVPATQPRTSAPLGQGLRSRAPPLRAVAAGGRAPSALLGWPRQQPHKAPRPQPHPQAQGARSLALRQQARAARRTEAAERARVGIGQAHDLTPPGPAGAAGAGFPCWWGCAAAPLPAEGSPPPRHARRRGPTPVVTAPSIPAAHQTQGCLHLAGLLLLQRAARLAH